MTFWINVIHGACVMQLASRWNIICNKLGVAMHRDILLMLLTRARARRNCRSVVAMHKVVLMMLLAVVSSSAMAEWIKIGSTSMADQTVTYYADPATIRKSGNMVKMWNLSDFKSAKDAGNGNIYMSTKAQYEFDCKEEQTRLLYLISHRYLSK